MWATDGALLRLRLADGRVDGPALARLADVVEQHADGSVLVTRRAKFELRGVRDPDAAADALAQAGWLESRASARLPDILVAAGTASTASGRTVVAHLLATLRDRLAALPDIEALPAKFLIVVAAPDTVGVEPAADLRLQASMNDGWRLDVAVGRETRDGGAMTGSAERVAALATELIAAWIADGPRPLPRLRAADPARLRALVSAVSRDTAVACTSAQGTGDELGYDALATASVVSFVFGRIESTALRRLAEVVGPNEIIVCPDRRLLLPECGPGPRQRLAQVGAIVNVTDPRNGLAACVGAPGCMHGTTNTRADALWLAAQYPELAGAGVHVSGCAKGCAWRRSAPITLVARDGRYDLIRDGRPDDTPQGTGLTLRGLAERLKNDAARGQCGDEPAESSRQDEASDGTGHDRARLYP